jgi:hypothetical protein
MDIQLKEPLGANVQTLVKSNLTKNFGLDTENQFFGSIYAMDLLVLLEILASLDLPKIPVQPKILQFWKISLSNYWRVNIPLLWANFFKSLQI